MEHELSISSENMPDSTAEPVSVPISGSGTAEEVVAVAAEEV